MLFQKLNEKVIEIVSENTIISYIEEKRKNYE